MSTFPLFSLPPEILHHIFTFLDPYALAKLGQVNRKLHNFYSADQLDRLWGEVVYQPKYRNINNGFFKGKDLFINACLDFLKEEYHPQHPCYKTVQELTSVQDLTIEVTRRSRRNSLHDKFSNARDKDKVHIAKAIVSSNQLHQFVLKHNEEEWVDFLSKNIIPKEPSVLLQLLVSHPFQEWVVSKEATDKLMEMLGNSDKATIRFFVDPALVAWREQLFSMRVGVVHLLKKKLFEILGKYPRVIFDILKDKSFQKYLLAFKDQEDKVNKEYILDETLSYSEECPVMLFENSELAPLQQVFFSALSDIEEKPIDWIVNLIEEHKGFHRLVSKHSKELQLLTCCQIESLVEYHPKEFLLVASASERNRLKDQFNLLKENKNVDNWLSKKEMKFFPEFVTQVFLDDTDQLLSLALTEMQLYEKNSAIPTILAPSLNITYLISSFHRDLVDQKKLTLFKLLQLTPSEFLKGVPHDKVGEAASALLLSSNVESWEVDGLEDWKSLGEKYSNKVKEHSTYTRVSP